MTINRADPPLEALFFALIPCAGQGSRAGLPRAKQYQVIAGQAMVLHTLAAFSKVARLTRTLVVVAPGDRFFEALPHGSVDVAACGGASRADEAHREQLAEERGGICLIEGPEAARHGAKTIGVRPEHIAVSPTSGEWKGRVGVSEHLGSDTFFHVHDTGLAPLLTVRAIGDVALTHGDMVYLTPDATRIHRFGETGLRL